MNIQAQVKKATKTISRALSLPEGPGEESQPDILDTLKKEHDEVRALLSDLQDATASAERKALVKKIKMALIPHTKAEEKVVYNAVIALKDKDAQTDGHEGYIEHLWASKTLERLDKIANATSPEHKAAAKVLKELVEHHIKEEENNVWSDVRENFSDEERLQMNAEFEAAKKKVRIP
jgi:hemerythrin-like domain-containing protein